MHVHGTIGGRPCATLLEGAPPETMPAVRQTETRGRGTLRLCLGVRSVSGPVSLGCVMEGGVLEYSRGPVLLRGRARCTTTPLLPGICIQWLLHCLSLGP